MYHVVLFLVGFSVYKADTVSADLSFRLQTRGTAVFQEDATNFGISIRRARLNFGGNFFEFKYKIQGAFEGSSASLLDFEVEREVAKNFSLRFGQYKVPSLREEINSSGNLELVDRSFINKEFSLERDIGVDLIFGDKKKYALNVGTFTGWGKNLKDISKNRNMMFVFRFAFAPEGQIIYSQPNLKKERSLNLGIFASVFPVSAEESAKMRGKSKSTGVIGKLVLKDNEAQAGTLAHGSIDLKLWYDILGLEIEGVGGAFLRHDGSKNFFGGRIQPSLMLTDKIGFAGRFSIAKIGDLDDEIEVTLGPSYYIRGNDAKLQADYTFGEYVSPDGVKVKSNIIRVQMQVVIK